MPLISNYYTRVKHFITREFQPLPIKYYIFLQLIYRVNDAYYYSECFLQTVGSGIFEKDLRFSSNSEVFIEEGHQKPKGANQSNHFCSSIFATVGTINFRLFEIWIWVIETGVLEKVAIQKGITKARSSSFVH